MNHEEPMSEQKNKPFEKVLSLEELIPYQKTTDLKKDPNRCVDGRPAPGSAQGAQKLGGTFNVILLKLVDQNETLTQENFDKQLNTLQNEGYKAGFHRDNHHHETGKCGCGFCDRIDEIIKVTIDNKELIINSLDKVIERKDLEDFYTKLELFDQNNRKTGYQFKGEQLVAGSENQNCTVETVQGNHNESAAVYNTKPGTTLDTIKLNSDLKQVFWLDGWAAIEEGKALGINEKFTQAGSAALFFGTKLVLNPQAPVWVN